MATVVNKTTFEIIESAHTPNYSPAEWIINPQLPDCAKKYWKLVGNSIHEMTQEEKDAVDLAETQAQEQAQEEWDSTEKQIVNKDNFTRALIKSLLDVINEMRTESGIDLPEKSLQDLQTSISEIYDTLDESGESG